MNTRSQAIRISRDAGNAYRRRALESLRDFARYKTHGGYSWAAVMSGGDCLCETCIRANYRQVYASTRDGESDGWCVERLTNSGETDSEIVCANCYKIIAKGLNELTIEES